MFHKQALPLFVSVLLFGLSSCRQQSAQPASQASSNAEAYTPGLGEIMTLQQMRHTKLWLAGDAGNWDLAAYEIDELGEGFEDAIKFHPTHKESPVAPKDAIPRMMNEPLMEVRRAIEKKDKAAFEQSYDKVTAACNSCHEATNFSFNVVRRPDSNPYPNQIFAPVHKSN
jgi:cytochrome c553